jgi:hypothetical protein
MWILVSASTTRVFVAFSIVNFVLPFCRCRMLHSACYLAARKVNNLFRGRQAW